MSVAAALSGGCSALLTNARELQAVPGLRILQLKDVAAVTSSHGLPPFIAVFELVSQKRLR